MVGWGNSTRIVDPRVASLQERVASLAHELAMVKSERDCLVERVNATDTTAELMALRLLADTVDRRLCGVGTAQEERLALAKVREVTR